MVLDIKTTLIDQRRQTFGHVARRFGEDRPASRYEEATYDLQPDGEHHYRPTWDPAHTIYDESRTAIVMKDWYALKDPRHYYYGTYTISRARMMETVEKNLAFVEKRGSFALIAPEWQEAIRFYLLPLRHVEWGANMNACSITDQGFGAAITQATMFATTDRLGIAQVISRIGLIAGGGGALDQAKALWMEAPEWQPMRRLVEDSFVVADWFELFVAQFLCLDGLLYPLVYDAFDAAGQAHGAAALSMMTEFMVDWQDETAKWADAVLKVVAQESQANRDRLAGWFGHWEARVAEALAPVAARVLGAEAGAAALADGRERLARRVSRLGFLPVHEEALA